MGATTAPAKPAEAPWAKRRRAADAGPKTPWWLWVVVTAVVLFCLVPFYWWVSTALRRGGDLTSGPPYPPSPTLKNYQSIFRNGDFTRALLNSAVVSIVTTVLALTVGSFCAYALARLRFRGKFAILALVLSITTFPAIAIAAPLFRLWSDIGIYNTWIGLIIPNLTSALPLTISILVSFFKEIPKDLEEAALVDGATYFQAFRKVVVPLAAPGLATAGILTFIGAWNEFLFAITPPSPSSARTAPPPLPFSSASTLFDPPLGTISAASVVISVPLIFLVLFFQKRIVAGLTAGAVKG